MQAWKVCTRTWIHTNCKFSALGNWKDNNWTKCLYKADISGTNVGSMSVIQEENTVFIWLIYFIYLSHHSSICVVPLNGIQWWERYEETSSQLSPSLTTDWVLIIHNANKNRHFLSCECSVHNQIIFLPFSKLSTNLPKTTCLIYEIYFICI